MLSDPLVGFKYRCECGHKDCAFGADPFVVVAVGNAAMTTSPVIVIEFLAGHPYEGIALLDRRSWQRGTMRMVKEQPTPPTGEPPVCTFMREAVVVSAASVPVQSLYLAYCYWAGRRRRPYMGLAQFVTSVTENTGIVPSGSDAQSVFPGVAVRDEWAGGVPQRKDADDDGA